MSVETFTQDNLITTQKPLCTYTKLQLESGQSVTRGEMLKAGTTGLVALSATSDTPIAVALETVDASTSAKDITYSNDCSVDVRELTFATGALADFRVAIMQNTNIFLEGDE